MSRKIQQSVSRLDLTHAREEDIPHYTLWEDHSEYEVFLTGERSALRRYHGPQFGRPLGDWYTETESWS